MTLRGRPFGKLRDLSLITSYFFTCLWYSWRLQTSNLPKSCLSLVSEGKEALTELPCERLAFGVL